MTVRSANRQQLSGLFSPGTVLIPPSDQPEREILRRLLDRLELVGRLDDADSALEIMFNHRCCSFIELAAEVVVVHSKLKGVHELTLAMAVSPGRISCECLAPAVHQFRVLILVLTPFCEPSGYIRVVSALRRVFGDPEWVERLCSLNDAESVWRLFDDQRTTLPDYVSAGDIMRTEMHVLRDTDSLSTAIDAFCEFDLTELPVVDKDGDLVGVVSEDELLRICLPEYVTWTEDLSSILDFEPFAEVLRREEEMPLMEIMLFAERYAAVQEDTPAIGVAKTMMRNDIQQVLVTRGQRLIGLISLSDFIRKVLRA